MATIDGALNGILSTPLVLPAPVAVTVAALVLVLLVMAFRPAAGGGARSLLLPLVLVALTGFALTSVLDRMARNEQAAERRALEQRIAELTARALTPGSMLACLDGAAGETVADACEKAIFAGPQSTASAIAYTAARLTLLADGSAFVRNHDPDFATAMAPLRRAIELDRFGVAARVLAVRDGCTADHCAAFALFEDTNVIKSNLKAQIFDQYVSRYAADWNKSVPVVEKEAPPPAPVASAAEPPAAPPAKAAAAGHYDFPSAASIPPVSIMTAEPPRPKSDAQLAQPAGAGDLPVPARRPQAQAASPPVR